ncbi:MAG: Ig-like domain-containing protein [Pseudoxanthomonas sp.]
MTPLPALAQSYCSADNIYSIVNGGIYRHTPGAASDVRETALDFTAVGNTNGLMLDAARDRLLFVSRPTGTTTQLWYRGTSGPWVTQAAFASPDFPRAGMNQQGVGYLVAGGTTTPAVWTVQYDGGTGGYIAQPTGTMRYSEGPTDVGSGDIAFDAQGNGWLVAGADLYRIDFSNDTPASTDQFIAQRQTRPLLNGAPVAFSWAGVAFSGDGSLYLGRNTATGTVYYSYDTGSGAITPRASSTGGGSRDLTSCSFPSLATPQLAVTKALATVNGAPYIGGASVNPGDTLAYTILINNTGGAVATLFPGDVQETLPQNTTVVPAGNSFTCSGGSCGNAQAVNVPANGSVTLTFLASVNAPLPEGATSIRNGVSVAGVAPVDCTAAGNTCTVDTPVGTAAPIEASNDSGSTPPGTPVTTQVLLNDRLNGQPVDPQAVTVTVTTPPGSGTAVVNPDNTITYTPPAGFSGSISYQYQYCETARPTNCATATVTITVPSPLITAVDDDVVGDADTPVVIPVVDNDNSTGAPLDPGSVVLVVPPTQGEVVCATGACTYTPQPGFTGTDSFRYQVCDTATTPACGQATVTITIQARTELRVLKSTNARTVRIGDLVRYSLTVENIGQADLVNGRLLDTPPAGFTYVDGSLAVTDRDNMATVRGGSPLQIEGLDIAVGQRATLVYLLRVGAGVRQGTHVNQAQALSAAGNIASNIATANVTLDSDPLLDESLIFGTVFDDRDGDGWQDSATLTGLQAQGGFAADAYIAGSTEIDRGDGFRPESDASAPLLHGLALGELGGRASQADPVERHRIVIRQRLRALQFTDGFALRNRQGAGVLMAADGATREQRSGDAARGLTAAQPQVQRRVSQGEGGYIVDYIIDNAGIDERGIPGVRIAAVEGLLMETDQFGRYHLTGMDGGEQTRGRNFILKVDPTTLPADSRFTTDNPVLRRITPGVPVRFDFGVTLPVQVLRQPDQRIELELGEVIFAPGSAQVRAEHAKAVEAMAARVTQYQGGEVLIAANGDQALAWRRAEAVKAALLEKLSPEVADKLRVSLRDHLDDTQAVAALDGRETLLGTVLFDTDSARIRPQYAALLQQVARGLAERGGGAIAIVGHTDVRGSHAYNTALGLKRARAVYEAIAAQLPPDVRAKVRVEASNDPSAPADAGR